MYNFVRVKNGRKHFEFRNPHFKRDCYDDLWKITRRPVQNAKTRAKTQGNKQLSDQTFKPSFLKNGLEIPHQTLLYPHLIPKESGNALYRNDNKYEEEPFNGLKALFLNFCHIANEEKRECMVVLRKGINDLLVSVGVSPKDNTSLKHLIHLCQKLAQTKGNTRFVEGLKELWQTNFSNIEIEPKDIFIHCKSKAQQNELRGDRDLNTNTTNLKRNSKCDNILSFSFDANKKNKHTKLDNESLRNKISRLYPIELIEVPHAINGSHLYTKECKKETIDKMNHRTIKQ